MELLNTENNTWEQLEDFPLDEGILNFTEILFKLENPFIDGDGIVSYAMLSVNNLFYVIGGWISGTG